MCILAKLTIYLLRGKFWTCSLGTVSPLIQLAFPFHSAMSPFLSEYPTLYQLFSPSDILTNCYSSVIHLSILLSTLPRTNKFLAHLHGGHASTVLTDYELSQPNTQQMSATKSSNTSAGEVTEPSESHPRSRSQSVGHDSLPLKLIPSLETKFSTSVSSRKTSRTAQSEKKTKSKKRSVEDWRTYVGLAMGSKPDEETSTSSLYNVSGIGGVVVGKELKQEVEYVPSKGGQGTRYHVAKVERRGSKVS